jgi:hydroxymethylbilane synthase
VLRAELKVKSRKLKEKASKCRNIRRNVMADTIRIGTRGSDLALWQAKHVAGLLAQAYPSTAIELKVYTTKGDSIVDKALPAIGGKGLFTEELERALMAGEIDCAVHSLKDLPVKQAEGLRISTAPERAAVEDVLISKHGLSLDQLPKGAKIGTSSLRRSAQLLHYRSDLHIIDIRGNVPTRISKALDPSSEYDGTILAQAGVERLGLMDKVSQIIPLEIMLPAPAQGAIGIQHRNEESFHLGSHKTFAAVSIERAFLGKLDGGCSVPVAAYAEFLDEKETILRFRGAVISIDGKRRISIDKTSTILEPKEWGMFARVLANEALAQGAADILAEAKQ